MIKRTYAKLKASAVYLRGRTSVPKSFSYMNKHWKASPTSETHSRLQDNPEEFVTYHNMYEDLRESWTFIPFEVIAFNIRALDGPLKVVDMGCGDKPHIANILRGFHHVTSYDHVSLDETIIATDITNTPAEDETFDVAAMSLALMGSNWEDYFNEVSRILKVGGLLVLGETPKHAENPERITKELEKAGLFVNKYYRQGDFYFFEAIKG